MKNASYHLLDSEEKYKADLYYIAPFYHRHFPSLDKLIALDMTDLRFLDDIELLHDQFRQMKKEQIIGRFQILPKMSPLPPSSDSDCAGMGPDLSPHYHLALQSHYRPGLSQGLNTGVVLYQLERMRSSQEYNKYLQPEFLPILQQKYQYKSVSNLSRHYNKLNKASDKVTTRC